MNEQDITDAFNAHPRLSDDPCDWFAAGARWAVASALQAVPALTPSEALYGFAAWLTGREPAVTFGACHDAAVPAELVNAFCLSQGLEPPRTDFHKRLRPYPAPSQRECNACDWKGSTSETCMLGSIGPLCPECRETTEPAAPAPVPAGDALELAAECKRLIGDLRGEAWSGRASPRIDIDKTAANATSAIDRLASRVPAGDVVALLDAAQDAAIEGGSYESYGKVRDAFARLRAALKAGQADTSAGGAAK